MSRTPSAERQRKPMGGLREYLRNLTDAGHVSRVARRVTARHELAGVQWKVERSLFKTVVFERVDEYPGSTVGNLFLAPLRTGVLPPVPFVPEYSALYAAIRKPGIVYPLWAGNELFLNMYREVESVVMTALANPVEPVPASHCWVHEYRGNAIDLVRQVPAPWYFREDAGPYLTAAVTVARDPESGYVNAGIYRIQVLDGRRLAIMVNAKRDLLSIIYAAARAGTRLPVAVAVGVAPEMLVAATMSVPFGVSEYSVAGALGGSPYGLASGDTAGLPVPADAEFLIEGFIDPLVRVEEGPFTEYDLIASQTTRSFCIEVTAVRTREEPVFHSLVCTSLEMVSLIMPLGMTELAKTRTFLKAISPNVHDLFMLPGVPGTGLAVSIHKQSGSEPMDILRALFAFSARLKRIVVVDAGVDIYDPCDVQWAVDTRVVAPRDIMVIESTGELTDPARVGDFSVKIGFDATIKSGHPHRVTRSETGWMEETDLGEYLPALQPEPGSIVIERVGGPLETVEAIVGAANADPAIARTLLEWDRTIKLTVGSQTGFIVVEGGKARMAPHAASPDISFQLSEETLDSLLAGRITPLMAKLRGLIRSSGSTMDILRFARILSACAKQEAPAN